MAVATKPTVPSTPLRTDPSTFSARMESMVDFFSPLLDYIAESNGFTEGEAQTALAAAMAGRLGGATLSSLANRLLAVNSGRDGNRRLAILHGSSHCHTRASIGRHGKQRHYDFAAAEGRHRYVVRLGTRRVANSSKDISNAVLTGAGVSNPRWHCRRPGRRRADRG